jgi:hypothetical protein
MNFGVRRKRGILESAGMEGRWQEIIGTVVEREDGGRGVGREDGDRGHGRSVGRK